MSTKPTTSRRLDGKPETDADRRFFDLRAAGYTGPIDQDGYRCRLVGRDLHVLHVTGRDVEKAEYAMAFTPTTGRWSLLDLPVRI